MNWNRFKYNAKNVLIVIHEIYIKMIDLTSDTSLLSIFQVLSRQY